MFKVQEKEDVSIYKREKEKETNLSEYTPKLPICSAFKKDYNAQRKENKNNKARKKENKASKRQRNNQNRTELIHRCWN
jgi:hypothetical protein